MFDLKNRASPNTKDAIVQRDILHVILQTVSVVVTGIVFMVVQIHNGRILDFLSHESKVL